MLNKTILLVFLVTVSLFSDTLPSVSECVVKRIETKLPRRRKAAQAFLWSSFARLKEHEKFSVLTTQNWESNYRLFSEELVRKAKEESLDDSSLKTILARLLPHANSQNVMVPVGAYQGFRGRKSIWIVVYRWERNIVSDEGRDYHLSHIKMYAVETESLECVGYSTCM